MIINDVSAPAASSPGTTAYCDRSPSPGSPSTRNDSSAGSETKKSGWAPRANCSATQRRRTSSVGSLNRLAMKSLRDRHSTIGLSQENPRIFLSGSRFSYVPSRCVSSQPAPEADWWELGELMENLRRAADVPGDLYEFLRIPANRPGTRSSLERQPVDTQIGGLSLAADEGVHVDRALEVLVLDHEVGNPLEVGRVDRGRVGAVLHGGRRGGCDLRVLGDDRR